MLENADFNMNVLVYNVVSGNRYSHCRLCLKEIEKDYLRLEDPVCLDKSDGIFQSLQEILNELLGDKDTEDIPGIDALCLVCVEKAIESTKFLNMCNSSIKILHRVFDNILEMLQMDFGDVEDKSLFITMNDVDSQCILILKDRDNDQKVDEKDSLQNKLLQCSICYESFENVTYLKGHKMVCHSNFTCKTCCETFENKNDLELHMKGEHTYHCSECNVTKKSEESLKQHYDKIHNTYICKDCGKSCRGLDKLYNHEQKHVVKNECPKCGKSYATKEFFMKHVKLCLEDRIDPHPIRSKIVKTFTCKLCGKGYSTEGGLRVHTRFVHGNAKPHVCNQCGKKFTAPSYLKIHMVTHTGEKNFLCKICNNRFVSKEALLYHTRRHTGEKPYSCYICNEKFVNASARAEHIKFRHIGPTLKCEICSRKFVTTHFLKQHMSRHHDPASKLYTGRNMIPPNMPGEQNMRIIIPGKES